MRTIILLAVALGSVLVGCGQADESGVPQAWTKLDDHAKLEKIKNMSLGPQQKVEAINNLKLSADEKQRAIAEVQAGSAAPSGGTAPRP